MARVDFLQLRNLGYYPLLPIIPPDGELAPDAPHVLIHARGKVPGCRQIVNGKPGRFFYPLPRWRDHAATETELRWYSETDCNAGLPLGFKSGVYCLDLDINDLALSQIAAGVVLRSVPGAVARVGNSPRVSFYFRAAPNCPEIRRRRIKFADNTGREHLLELLGEGQQSVIAGVHPKTKSWFVWSGNVLVPPSITSLPTLSDQQLFALHDLIMSTLAGAAGCRLLAAEGRLSGGAAVPQNSLLAPDLEALRAAIARIPNSHEHFPTRHSYLDMGYAIKAAGGLANETEAFQIFLDWCERWDTGANDYEVVANDWRRLVPPFRVGWEWLTHRARDLGVEIADLDFGAALALGPPPSTGATPGPIAPPPTPPPATAQPSATPSTPDTLGPDPADNALPDFAPQYTGHVEWSERQAVERFKAEHGWRFLYLPGKGTHGEWLTWNGQRWTPDQGNMRLAECVGYVAHQLGQQLRAGDPSPQGIRLARALSNSYFQSGVMLMLKRSASFVASATDFDRDPWLLNTPAGLLDLRTNAMRAHDPTKRCRLIAGISPRLDPTPQDWQRTGVWLLEVFNNDVELINFVLDLLAYCLTGDMRVQRWYFAFGTGANGKSTLLNLIQHILGDYATATSAETFQAQRPGAKNWSMANFVGKRFVHATETTAHAAWNTALLSGITGGDPVESESKYATPVTYQPQFKIMIAGNSTPRFRSVDHAIRRRFVGLPFAVEFKLLNTAIPAILESEAPAFFGELCRRAAALWRGIAAGQQSDQLLPLPKAVVAETEDQIEIQDTLQDWLNSRCDTFPAASATWQELWFDFSRFLDANDHGWTKVIFATELRKRGFTRQRLGQKKIVVYSGVQLLPAYRGAGDGTGADLLGTLDDAPKVIDLHTRKARPHDMAGE